MWWAYQVAHKDLGLLGCTSWASRCGGLHSRPRRLGTLLYSSYWRLCSPSCRATSSTASTATAATVGADDVIKTLIQLGRHVSWKQVRLVELVWLIDDLRLGVAGIS